MKSSRLLKKKHDQLQVMLNQNQQKKHMLELKINHEFMELKKTEIFLEILSAKESAAKQQETTC
jgi:phage-related minor tail protein